MGTQSDNKSNRSYNSTSNYESEVTSLALNFKIETFIYIMSITILPREHNNQLIKQILRFHKNRLKEAKVESDDYTSSDY